MTPAFVQGQSRPSKTEPVKTRNKILLKISYFGELSVFSKNSRFFSNRNGLLNFNNNHQNHLRQPLIEFVKNVVPASRTPQFRAQGRQSLGGAAQLQEHQTAPWGFQHTRHLHCATCLHTYILLYIFEKVPKKFKNRFFENLFSDSEAS